MSRIGIFGGTFDPPHLGHLILAETCAEALDLERVLWVPAADPPHKRNSPVSAARHRVAMVEATIAGNPRFALSRADLDRPGPNYSVDLVRIVVEEYPEAELFFLMGSDSLRDLPRWYEPVRLLEHCRLGVYIRPAGDIGEDVTALGANIPGLKDAINFVSGPLIEVSGTDIRRRVRARQSIRYRVVDAVAEYIAREELYR